VARVGPGFAPFTALFPLPHLLLLLLLPPPSSIPSIPPPSRGHWTAGANPFPKVTDPFCRLPLPTLFYQLEAIHLGDLLRLLVRPVRDLLSLGFSWATQSAPGTCLAMLVLCLVLNLFSSSSVFKVHVSSQIEQVSLSRTLFGVSKFSLRYHPKHPFTDSGILTGFPFALGCPFLSFQPSGELTPRLRIDSPMSKHCSHGTLLLFSLQSSHPFEYLLLPPRSALEALPINVTIDLYHNLHAFLLVKVLLSPLTAEYRYSR
jgi:hypothetical protein